MSQQTPAPRGETARELGRLALRRIASAPKLSAVLLIGALLAVGLASSAPIFIEAVRDLGLRQTLADADPATLDLRFNQTGVSADSESVGDVESLVNDEVSTAAASLTVGRMTALRTGGYILRTDDEPFDPPDADHVTFVAQSDISDLSDIVAGRTPEPASGVLEVMIERRQAQDFGLDVGDERLAQPFWLGTEHETRVRVVGILEPSADERRWSTLDSLFLPIAALDTELRFWTTREGILGILADQSPTLRLSLLQRFRTDLRGASAAEASAAADSLEQMTRRIAQSVDGIQQETELVDTLVGFSRRFQFAQSTLLMIVLQLVGAVLVYAVVAAAMLAEQRTEDTAWLRSRGARQRDVAVLHLVEAAILTAPAIALGPLIGMGLVSLLGFVPPFDEALAGTGTGPFLPVPLPIEAWYLALGAGALALLAQAVPTFRATRQTMVTTRRERGRPPASWTQRALIDAAVAALGALLIFELQWAGDPIDSPLVGETRLGLAGGRDPDRAALRRRPGCAASLPAHHARPGPARLALALADAADGRLVPRTHAHPLRPHRAAAHHRGRARRLRRLVPHDARQLLQRPLVACRRRVGAPGRAALRSGSVRGDRADDRPVGGAGQADRRLVRRR